MLTIMWFRQDLRLADNPALSFALDSAAVIPVFLWSPGEESPWQPGGAANWWLHHSLESLRAQLRQRGSELILRNTADSGAGLATGSITLGAKRTIRNPLRATSATVAPIAARPTHRHRLVD